jgi:hypothetical protein
MSMEVSSRRSFIRALSVLPAAAIVPAVAVGPAWARPSVESVDDPVIALAEKVVRLQDVFEASCKALNGPESALMEWRKKNPLPLSVKVEGEALDAAATAGLSEHEQGIVKILRSGEKYAAAVEQNRADMRRWQRRQRAAERRTGFAKAYSDQEAACHAAADAQDALRDAIPKTFAGLAAKARAARYIKDQIREQADELGWSLIYDLGILAGEIGPDDRPDFE